MERKAGKIVALLVCAALWLSSCERSGLKPQQPVNTDSGRVHVVCEGSLGNGNASLGVYVPGTLAFNSDVYQQVNGQPIGDVLQSMTKIGDRYFLCVNNSDRVLVLDDGYKLLGNISIPKPRYIHTVSDTKAYVSSIFNNKLYIINPQTMTLAGSITLPARNAENMLMVNNDLWVCTWDTAVNTLYKIDPATDAVTSTVTVAGQAPQELAQDKDGNIWVLSGNVVQGKQAALTVLNTAGQILKSYQFPTGADPLRLEMNIAKDIIYFIEVNYNGGTTHNGVFRMGIDDAQLPTQPLISAGQFQYYWALGINPKNDDIYVGDPKGFTQQGIIQIYDKDGNAKTSFSCGVGPGQFYFE